ncbi:hypothetical protein Droror1_Dr00023546, partial [Drosera rotundifolia]
MDNQSRVRRTRLKNWGDVPKGFSDNRSMALQKAYTSVDAKYMLTDKGRKAVHDCLLRSNMEALDVAAGKVEKLLQPVDEVLKEHKRRQLRELAALDGTLNFEMTKW